MTLWVILAAMTVGSLALLVMPLVRAKRSGVSRAVLEREVYRDQLKEVQRELERGLLSTAEAEAATTEISRHMLATARAEAAEAAEGQAQGRHRAARRIALVLTAVLVPAGALGLYLYLGSPQEPGYPYAARLAERDQVAQHDDEEFTAIVARLAERLEREPNDLEGWILLARSYNASGQYREAADAYRKAIGLAGEAPELLGAYAESLTAAAGGIVTPEAAQLFERVRRALPNNSRSRYYLGLARVQAGDGLAALEIWLALAAEAPPDAPWLPGLREQIAQASREFGIDPATVTPERPLQAASPGPTQEDVAAAQSMTGDEQAAMIQSMVERLASRLEDNPEDTEGWLRLARAYQVLGRPDSAKQAVLRAAESDPAPPLKARVVEAARELGMTSVFESEPEEDSTSQTDESGEADDQMAMIRGMVDGLAERLQREPDDLAGWIRLGRSYIVLQEPAKARAAFARAVALEPGNVSLVLTYADAILAAPGAVEPLHEASVKAMRDVLRLDENNPQALWYVGLAEVQGQDLEAAALHWRKLLAQLEPGTQDYRTVKNSLDALSTN